MKIASADPGPVLDERELLERLPLQAARVIELGCGTARQTQVLAESGKCASIVACEVDERQHAKNLARPGIAGVRFVLCGAENIVAEAGSVDAVFLFKSLHHVPVDKLDQAFVEIYHVLAPGGLLYISEPIFAGDYNDILRLFHDERAVREAAFAATCRAVAAGGFAVVSQTFFQAPIHYRSFEEFQRKVIEVTHTRHSLTPELLRQVRARFEAHMTDQGARFEAPFRVDLLRKIDAPLT